MEPAITLGAEVVVIGVDKHPEDVYKRKKQLIGKIGEITGIRTTFTDANDMRYEVCFDSTVYCFFYERNLSLDLSLAAEYPATDQTIPETKIAKNKKHENT